MSGHPLQKAANVGYRLPQSHPDAGKQIYRVSGLVQQLIADVELTQCKRGIYNATHNRFMNLASILKAEIAKVARKEVRTEVAALKKSVAAHRSDIAALKRQITDLQKQTRQLVKLMSKSAIASHRKNTGKTPSAAPAADEQASHALRFRPQGLASHRQRLGLSAQAMGQLLGVSGQSVTAWETGKTAPRRSQLPAIAEVRKLSKREAAARISME